MVMIKALIAIMSFKMKLENDAKKYFQDCFSLLCGGFGLYEN